MGVTVGTSVIDAYLDTLTDEQRTVAEAMGTFQDVDATQVVACAGAGKTRSLIAGLVLASRIYPPGQIIATTFTRKAREEVRKRLDKLDATVSRKVEVATLNSLAMKFCKAQAGRLASLQPELFGDHLFQSGYKMDGGGGGRLPIRQDTLILRIVGKRRFKRKDRNSSWYAEEIPGLEGTGFTGLSLNGNRDRRETGYREPGDPFSELVTETKPGDYLKLISLFRHRGFVGGEPAADVYIRAVSGDADAVAELNEQLPTAPPLERAWISKVIGEYGKYPYFGEVWSRFNQAKQKMRAWDFIDTLYAFWRYGDTAAKLVVVDEAQDNSWLQMQISVDMAKRAAGTLFCFFDIRQCIPEGEVVYRNGGEVVPIEAVRVGDHIQSSAGGEVRLARVTNISTTVKQSAFEFTLEGGTTFRATPEHACFAALGKPQGYYVYLMYREGYGFRLGSTQATGEKGLTHLIVRTQQERAQRLWILDVAATSAEAHTLEHTLAYRFRVPMAPFKPRPGTMFQSEDDAAAFFSEFVANGHDVLRAYQQDFDRPPYFAKSSQRGCVSVNLVLAASKGRTISKVLVESQHLPDEVKSRFGFIKSKSGCYRLSREYADGRRLVQLAADIHGALVDHGVHAHVAEVLSVPSADRRVFQTPAASIHPGMYVPCTDPDGVVRLRLVIARREVAATTCYDLEIEDTLNFVVGTAKAVVHNSIFSFQGASPAFMQVLHEVARVRLLEITTNFRSRRRIVMLGNTIAEGRDWVMGQPAWPARREDGQMLPGVVTCRASHNVLTSADEIAAAIAESIASGASEGDHAVLSRSHSVADIVEMALLRRSIPLVRLGQKRTFFDSVDAQAILTYLNLTFALGPVWPGIVKAGGIFKIANGKEHHPRYINGDMFARLAEQSVQAGMTETLPALIWMRDRADNDVLSRGVGTLVEDVKRLRTSKWPDTLDIIEEFMVPPLPDAEDKDAEALEQAANEAEDAGEEGGDPDARTRAVIGTVRLLAADKDLAAFREFVAKMRPAEGNVKRFSGGADDEEFALNYDDVKKGRVTLSTVHVSKGLEWKKVYMIVPFGLWPNFRADPEEERRLYYVAVTRGEDEVHVRYPRFTEDDRPMGVSDFVEDTEAFLDRDTLEIRTAGAVSALGWHLTGDVQVQIAERKLQWESDRMPTRVAALDLDQVVLTLDGSEIARGAIARIGVEVNAKGAPLRAKVERLLRGEAEEEAAVEVDVGNDRTFEAQPMQPAPGVGMPTAANRRAAFAAWVAENYPHLIDQVDDVDFTGPMRSEEAMTTLLGWSTVADLGRVVENSSPFTLMNHNAVSVPTVKTASGVTCIWAAENGVIHFSGAAPVDPTGPDAVWGLANAQRTVVSWPNDTSQTLPVGAPAISDSHPHLPGLRYLASGQANGPARALSSAKPFSTVFGPAAVHERGGQYELIVTVNGREYVVETAANASFLVRAAEQIEAAVRAGARLDALTRGTLWDREVQGVDRWFTVTRSDSSASIEVTARSPWQAIEHALLAEGASFLDQWLADTLGASGEYTSPRGVVWQVVAQGAERSPTPDPAPRKGKGKGKGSVSPEAAPEPAITPADASPPPVDASPSEAPPGLEVRDRSKTLFAAIPKNADVLVDVVGGKPVYEVLTKRDIVVRDGMLLLHAPPSDAVREMTLLRVRVQPRKITLEKVLTYVPGNTGDGMTAAQSRILAFYSRVGDAMRAIRGPDDPFTLFADAHPVSPAALLLARAADELDALHSGVQVAPTGRIQTSEGLVLTRTGSAASVPALLSELVAAGYLRAVGNNTYTWGF